MILLTVGTQLPFDRPVEAVDRIAPELDEPVIAQVGKGKYVCRNIEAQKNFGPVEFQEYLKNCSRIISHAEIGTILNAKKFRKPIILVPRLAKFGEHRNDYQLAACKHFGNVIGVKVCEDLSGLQNMLKSDVDIYKFEINSKSKAGGLISFLREEISKELSGV